MASVNRGSKQVADVKGNGPVNTDATSQSAAKTPDAARPKNTGKTEAGSPSDNSSALDESNIGGALRTVYQQTINEDIPAEMLDLLNKLT